MIEDLLKKIDFSPNEIEVYLTILKNGKISPARVSSITGINRTTTYGVAKKLVKLGLVAEDLGKKTHYLTALPPENLEKLIKKEEEQINKKKEIIKEAVNELQTLSSEVTYSIPKIKFIEENSLEDYLMERMGAWLESAEKIDSTAWGYRDHTFLENYSDWIDQYWKTAPPNHVLKLLSNKADIEKKLKGKYPKRHNKYWSKAQNFSVTLWVFGEYVIMVMTRQRPHYLIEIHDSVFAQNQRALFKGIWEELEETDHDEWPQS